MEEPIKPPKGIAERIKLDKRSQRTNSQPSPIRKLSSQSVPLQPSRDIIFCKFLIPQERHKASEKAEQMKFTSEEKAKVESLRQYFKQYWLSMVHYHNTRKARMYSVERMLQEQIWDEERKEVYRSRIYQRESQILRFRRTRITIQDFVLLAIIGRGGFGEVYLCRKRDTSEVLALKKFSKKHFVKKNNVWKLKRERDVMLKNESSWLVKLKYAFQSDKFVYLAMEFIPGGDLKNLLDHVGCFMETHAKFYFAEMILAVRDLHKLGYIHRDLKPDNFMVDRRGHLKLIDFGLSKDGHSQKYQGTISMKSNKTYRQNLSSPMPGSRQRWRSGRKLYSVVGSPEYMAIEILEEVGYNHTVDYWSLGVIMFELFYGITPFNSDTTEEALQKLTCWKDYLVPPEPVEQDEVPMSESGWDLITRLICEPSKRIGRVSIEEIMQHAWYKGFDWYNMLNNPPFVPVLDNEIDTSYFQNALDEQDYRDLSITVSTAQQLKDADAPDVEKIFKHGQISRIEEIADHAATFYKNSHEEMAFAGWTFRHEYWDLESGSGEEDL